MAHVACVAVSTQRVRGSSGCSCPGFLPGNFYLELLDHHPEESKLFTASEGARPLRELELSDPSARPPRSPRSPVPTPTLAGRSLVVAIAASGRR